MDAFEIGIKVMGVGEAQGILKRHLAPLTVGRLLRKLQEAPIASPAMVYGTGQICLQTTVVAGQEKAVRLVEPGDLGYVPQTSAICIFTEKGEPYSPVNKVGQITEGLELFKTLRTGMMLSIALSE
ncbi:MAG: cyclophilin-like family protein [Candidatus Heimdallarchaeota archaeon]